MNILKNHVDGHYIAILIKAIKYHICACNNTVKDLLVNKINDSIYAEVVVLAVVQDDKAKIPCPRNIAQSCTFIIEGISPLAHKNDFNASNITSSKTL